MVWTTAKLGRKTTGMAEDPDEKHRGVIRERITGEKIRTRRYGLIKLGPADDALRASGASATARRGALQRRSLAGKAVIGEGDWLPAPLRRSYAGV